MPETRKILRIKKQSYKFELRKKYFNRKKFRLREKRPLDAIVAELNKFFPKKVRESEGGRKNPLIAFALLLVIIGALVILFPPEVKIDVKKEQVFTAPLLNLTMKDEGVASLGGHASDLRSAYYKLETTAANADSLSVKTSIYDRRVPNQVFIFSSKTYQVARYFQFKYALKKRLEARGLLLTEISRAQVETLPAGSILIIPTGYIPEQFLEAGEGNIVSVLGRGVDVIYIGQKFDFTIDENGDTKRTNQTTLSLLPFVFEPMSLKPSALHLTSGLYKVRSKTSQAYLLYGTVSVVSVSGGSALFIPQGLDDGWESYDDAADDLEKIIAEMKWFSARAENEVKMDVKANETSMYYLASPPFKERSKAVIIKVVASNAGNKTEKTLFRYPRSDVNGDLFYVDDVRKVISGKITEQNTKFIVFLNENDPEKRNLYVSVKNVSGAELERQSISSGTGGKVELQGAVQFSVRLALDKGIYLVSVIDDGGNEYAKAVLQVDAVQVVTTSRDFANGLFKFVTTSFGGGAVKVKKMRIVVDGKYNYSFFSASDFSVNMESVLAGLPLAAGNHTFDFEFGEIKQRIVLEKVVQTQFYDNPIYWVMGLFALALFMVAPFLATVMRKTEYALDIPDFPPLASIKIPIRKDAILGIIERINEDYKWKNTPLKLDEIKKGFKRIIYKSKPVFISDYNLEYILNLLRSRNDIKEALDYYGLAKWEDEGRSMTSLAIYRKIRDICINEALPFGRLDESSDYDLKIRLLGQDIFIFIMDSPEAREKKLGQALKVMYKGLAVLLFQNDEDKKNFGDTVNSASESAGIVKLEIMTGSLVPLTILELEKMFREMKRT